ncbi:MAG: fibronectin type III domain-containing protein [Patescibacteria group bacterium]
MEFLGLPSIKSKIVRAGSSKTIKDSFAAAKKKKNIVVFKKQKKTFVLNKIEDASKKKAFSFSLPKIDISHFRLPNFDNFQRSKKTFAFQRRNKKIDQKNIFSNLTFFEGFFGFLRYKTRNFKREVSSFFSGRPWRKAVASFILVAVIIVAIFSNHSAKAASYTFSQVNWGGGLSTDSAMHPGGQSSWNKFEFKDANISVVNSGTALQLGLASTSITQTNNGTSTTGFNLAGASVSNAAVVGIGTSTNVQVTKSNFTKPMVISVGGVTTIALKSDGTVWAWGYNYYGQLGDGTSLDISFAKQVHGPDNIGYLTNIISIAGGSGYALALKSDGTVWAWGANDSGYLGDNTTVQKKTPVQVHGPGNVGFLTDIVSISSTGSSAYAVKSDGTVWAWGYNATYQLGDSTTTQRLTPVQVHGSGDVGFLTDVVSVSPNAASGVFALKSDGTVWAWGYNNIGQLGDNTMVNKTSPTQVHGPGDVGFLTGVVSLAASNNWQYPFTIAVKNDGTVWAWGINNYGQLGDNTTVNKTVPVQVHGTGNVGFLTGVSSASLSQLSSYAVKSDGTVWAWGGNSDGCLGDNTQTSRNTPIQVHGTGNVGFLTGVSTISSSGNFSVVLKSDGMVLAWGNNSYGQLGDSTTSSKSTPVQSQASVPENLNLGTAAIVKIVSPNGTMVALKSDGTVWAWGLNNYGLLGNGGTTSHVGMAIQVHGPGNVGFLTGITDVIANSQGSVFAIKSDGTVWAWGYNRGLSNLGDNSTTDRSYPVQVHGPGNVGFLTDVASIYAGYYATYAVKNDGTVWAWGSNDSSRLGDNTTTTTLVPVQVHGPGDVGFLTGVASLSLGDAWVYALKTDGTVWAWGKNTSSNLGDNTLTNRATPVQVHGPNDVGFLTGVTAVFAGYNPFAVALKNDGTLWAWGNNSQGGLGDGGSSYNVKGTPQQVKGINNVGFLAGVSSCYISGYNVFFLKTDGTLGAWGQNSGGELGDNTTTQRLTPIQVHGPGNVGFLTGVSNFIMLTDNLRAALKSDGTVYTWGDNSQGALGDNTFVNKNLPTQVHGVNDVGFLTNVIKVLAARTFFVVQSDGTVLAWGYNGSYNIGDGSGDTRKTPVNVKIYATFSNMNAGTDSYFSSGTYTSGVIDFGISIPSFSTVNISAVLPTSTGFSVDVRAGDTANPDGSWTGWLSGLTNGGNISSLGSHRYVQYKINLSTSNTSVSPSISDVTLGYNIYPASQTLRSSAYNTVDAGNIIGGLGMTEDLNLPTSTGVILSIRTAASQGSLASSTWYDFTNATSHCTKVNGVVNCPLSSLPSALTSGGDDQWWQYKLTLTSDGSFTPTVSGVSVKYVVNAPPELSNVSAVQGQDGKVNISYDVMDPDTHTGSNTPGKVTPSFEYWNGNAWLPCATLSVGATENKDVSDATSTTYTLAWDPTVDFNNHYITDAKIRVKVNDNETANNLASLESAAFTIDTVRPVVDSFILDARSDATNNISISVTENTLDGLKMKISNHNDLSPDGINSDSGTWIDYATTKTWVFANGNPSVYYQFKDKLGNISNSGAISQVSLPAKPLNIIFQDVSSIETSDWREFVAWGKIANPPAGFKQYNIYRSTDGTNYSLLTTQNDRSNNFVLDSGLDTSATYYYRVSSEDESGNISNYSNIVNDRPDGQGGSDLTPPVISNIQISDITAQSAMVTWETDEPANSAVSYITNDLGDFTDAPNVGVSSMLDNASRLGKHSVFLNNLTPGATYYIQVSSADPNSNLSTGGEGNSFTVLSGPTISNVQIASTQNTGATITWTTGEISDSHVLYSTDSTLSNPVEVGMNELINNHQINLTGLNPGTTYYFYVKSGVAEDKNILKGEVAYYNFTTASDVMPPLITFDPSTGVSGKTETAARISWTTDELASSSIEYSSDDSYSQVISNVNLNTNHSFDLTALTKGTLYNFRLKSADANGNLAVLSNLTFLTEDLTDTTPPAISGVQTDQIFDTSATIIWDTNEPANSLVNYGVASSTYSSSSLSTLSNYSHAVILRNLAPSTKYYYKVTSVDGNSNSSSSEGFSFTTSETLVLDSVAQAAADAARLAGKNSAAPSGGGGLLIIDKTDKIAPTISNSAVDSINSDQATITWNTDELADSMVEFGSTESFGSVAASRATSLTHAQILPNLLLNTLYYYKITSSDTSGNLSVPTTGTFTTLATFDSSSLIDNTPVSSTAPVDQPAADLKFTDILQRTINFIKQAAKSVSLSVLESSLAEQQKNLRDLSILTPAPKLVSGPEVKTWEDMAVVTWATDKKTSSLISFAAPGVALTDVNRVQNVGNPDVLSETHQVILSGLSPDTTYNYSVRGTSAIGANFSVSPAKFKTLLKSAKIDNYVADKISASTASFKWVTSIPTDSSVRTTPYRNNALAPDEARLTNNPKSTSIHEMSVDSFEPGIFYRVELFGRDSLGNTLSQSIDTFSTTNQELPLLIEQVKTDSALTAGNPPQVQSIISWDTTRPATSKIYYRHGTAGDNNNWSNETVIDKNYTRRHLIVMTDFLAGEVYQFQVESTDSNGKTIRSQTHTILTPRQQESVFQLIMNNIEQTFGWMGAVKQ